MVRSNPEDGDSFTCLLDKWKCFLKDELSKDEKKKRRLRKLFGKSPTDDVGIPDDIKALSNGIITDSNPHHSAVDGKFSSGRESGGSWSLDGKQYQKSRGSKKIDRAKCGRKKRADNHKYYCRSGKLKEQDKDASRAVRSLDDKTLGMIKKMIKQEVAALLKKRPTSCSIEDAARIVNLINRSEKGELVT